MICGLNIKLSSDASNKTTKYTSKFDTILVRSFDNTLKQRFFYNLVSFSQSTEMIAMTLYNFDCK